MVAPFAIVPFALSGFQMFCEDKDGKTNTPSCPFGMSVVCWLFVGMPHFLKYPTRTHNLLGGQCARNPKVAGLGLRAAPAPAGQKGLSSWTLAGHAEGEPRICGWLQIEGTFIYRSVR